MSAPTIEEILASIDLSAGPMPNRSTGFLCEDCMTWGHEPPECGHDSRAPCFDCGRPRGSRFVRGDGYLHTPAWQCSSCARAAPGNARAP
jgi:hypothetical protein